MAKVETVVFLSLILDLLSFTMPLPLFPRIIEWFTLRESGDPNGFLPQTLDFVRYLRSFFYSSTAPNSQKWDVVLLGGLMGSLFSTLQFLISPVIGSLSDKFGRKRILLITMAGNILSALIWLKSTTFATYLLSRVVGGASEGNVQLAIAIMSDVTTPETRSKALAHIGIAFAICFCIGPPIGAYFASKQMPVISTMGIELNVYALPAAITLALLILETIYLAACLPETRGVKLKATESSSKKGEGKTNGSTKDKGSVQSRIAKLRQMSLFHFLFLGIFSGIEFTLTFLTFDLFDWNNKQNGMLIGSIGVMSALLQGGYTRRATAKVGEMKMARRGVLSCLMAFILLGFLPRYSNNPIVSVRILQGAAICLSFASATVVNSLTAAASLQCDEGTVDSVTGKPMEEHPDLAKGKALGRFRSAGQLGRAMGPLLACASYWTLGPSLTYTISASLMCLVYLTTRKV